MARPSRWGADAGSGGDLQRLLELDEEEARGPAAAPAEAPILCCEATGCLCVVPGQRCGMAWVKKSEYEDDRAKQVDENEAFLRQLLGDDAVPPPRDPEADAAAEAAAEAAAAAAPLRRRAGAAAARVAGAGRGGAASTSTTTSSSATASRTPAAAARAASAARRAAPAASARRGSGRSSCASAARAATPTATPPPPPAAASRAAAAAGRAAGGSRPSPPRRCPPPPRRRPRRRRPRRPRRCRRPRRRRPAPTPAPAAGAAAAPSSSSSWSEANESLLVEAARLRRVGALEPSAAAANDANAAAVDALLHRTLREVFGLSDFRTGQLAAVQRVCRRQSTLLVLPTGGGKSLAYQLPACLSPQITIVVSPLLSLISDQLASLPAGLYGVALSSQQSHAQKQKALDGLRARDASGAALVRLLFVAPEGLSSHTFQQTLRTLPAVAGCRCGAAGAAAAAAAPLGCNASSSRCAQCGACALPALGVACIDEVHCLSEWSHNFRPAYMALGATLRDLGVPAVLGLTATATMRTVKSVCTSLRLPPDAQLRNSPHRPNLTFSAELLQTRGDEAGGGGNFGAAEDARVARVVKLVSEWAKGGGGGGAIIYCMRKYQCEQLAAALRGAGLKADHYHAGRPQEERQRVYARFMGGQLRVVAATVAFGMGIDKANVRLVVHAGLPRSLEQWVQETGRAGRDGAPAACHAVLRPADFIWLHSLCHSDHVAPEQMAALLRALTANAKNGYGDLPLDHLETKLDMNESVVQTALAFLAEVPLRAWRPPAADDGDGDDDGDDGNGDETLLELLPQIRRTAVLSFHQERPEAVAAQSPLVGVLLRHAKEHNGSYRCPLVQAASEVGLDAHAAHAELAALHRGGVLQFELRDPAFYVRFHCAPKQTEVDDLAAAMTAKMAEVEELQRTKLAAAATVLWALADDGKADGGGGASDADGGATRRAAVCRRASPRC